MKKLFVSYSLFCFSELMPHKQIFKVSDVVALISCDWSCQIPFRWWEWWSIPSLALVYTFQACHKVINQKQSNHWSRQRNFSIQLLSHHNDRHEKNSNKHNHRADNQTFSSILFSISFSKNHNFTCVPVSTHKWNIMKDVVNDTWNTSDVNQKRSDKPYGPIGPNELKFGVNEDSCSCDTDKPEKCCQHGWKGRFVNYIPLGTFVDEFQHFVGCYMAVRVRNGPLEFL